MTDIETLHAFDQIKLLADRRRMEILRLLMASPATLTDLAHSLGRSPAWVRHHVKALETAQLIELAETRTTGKVTEKFYRARAEALLLREVVLPKGKKATIIFSGSHDLGIEHIAGHLSKHLMVVNLPVGSLDGLINLRQGLCQIAGAHLLDESGEYNKPYVRHLFPDRSMELITLAHRTQGWIVAAGNPKKISGVSDLARPGVRLVNRNSGSGTRLWLDMELKKSRIAAETIHGYDHAVKTHNDAAASIAAGHADVALGLQAAARKHLLDFIPLFDERYDLVLSPEQEKSLAPFLEYIQTSAFRKALESLTGYNTTHSGEHVLL